MLQKNVVIGGIYETYVSDVLRRVRVIRKVQRTQYGYRSGDRQVTRFVVVDVKTGRELPKLRSSGSLREIEEARKADVLVQSDTHGQPSTVYTFTFESDDALQWAKDNIQTESSWLGVRTLVVEHRYVELLAEGLREAGYVVR